MKIFAPIMADRLVDARYSIVITDTGVSDEEKAIG